MSVIKPWYGLCRLFYLSIAGLLLLNSSWTLAGLNDPTKPIYSENANSSIVTNPVVEESKIILLQSILYGKNGKLAIINGELFREGDQVDGVLMESIHKSHVMVKYKENTLKIVLSKKIYINKLTGDISE